MEQDERVTGEWLDEARDFDEFKEAIRELLNKQRADSMWTAQLDVRKSGNPIHQYRIVLEPAG